MKKHYKLELLRWRKIFSLSVIIMLLFIWSCKKESHLFIKTDQKSTLSMNSIDYINRLEEIRKAFYQKGLDKTLKAKKDENLIWEPDWAHPKSQIVNDSVSYVFYPIRGYLIKDGKRGLAKILGAKPYLVVKNEKEFFKGLYYQPDNIANQNGAAQKEIIVDRFTGNLLLTNLETKNAFLIYYKNGLVVNNQLKNKLAYQKLMSIDKATSYFETQCHTEINSCTYYTYLPSCGGGFVVEYSFYCQQPSYCQNSIWILSDYNVDTVCEQVWFPDPPTDPGGGSGGNGGGDDSGGEYAYNPQEFQFITDPAIYLSDLFNCFNYVSSNGASYSITLSADIPVNSDPMKLVDYSNFPPSPGHAFITLTKTNGSTSVSKSFGFYPDPQILSLTTGPVGSKMNDNGGHEYDSRISMGLTEGEFQLAMTNAIQKRNMSYDIDEYNCTDYAIDVFNSVRAYNNQLEVSNWIGSWGYNYGTTPNGLHAKLAQMQSYGNNSVSMANGNAPAKSGSCN